MAQGLEAAICYQYSSERWNVLYAYLCMMKGNHDVGLAQGLEAAICYQCTSERCNVAGKIMIHNLTTICELLPSTSFHAYIYIYIHIHIHIHIYIYCIHVQRSKKSFFGKHTFAWSGCHFQQQIHLTTSLPFFSFFMAWRNLCASYA